MSRFLELLEDYISEDIEVTNIGCILNVLYDLGDTFLNVESGMFGSKNTPPRIRRITKQLLIRFESLEDRYTVLKEAFSSSNNSFLP